MRRLKEKGGLYYAENMGRHKNGANTCAGIPWRAGAVIPALAGVRILAKGELRALFLSLRILTTCPGLGYHMDRVHLAAVGVVRATS